MTTIKWTKLHKVLNDYADYFIQNARNKIGANNSYATGKLGDTLDKVIEITDDRMSVKIKLQDYWEYLDKGTKPHYPPIQAIKEWVEVKNIDISPYAIQKSIGEKGTQPHPFFNESKDNIYKQFENKIIYAIEEDIAEWVTDNINQMLS